MQTCNQRNHVNWIEEASLNRLILENLGIRTTCSVYWLIQEADDNRQRPFWFRLFERYCGIQSEMFGMIAVSQKLWDMIVVFFYMKICVITLSFRIKWCPFSQNASGSDCRNKNRTWYVLAFLQAKPCLSLSN